MTDNTNTDMLRPKQAAARFGVTERTLRRWALAGRIGRSEVDSQVWYVASDIADVLALGLTERSIIPLKPQDTTPVATVDMDEFAADLWAGTSFSPSARATR